MLTSFDVYMLSKLINDFNADVLVVSRRCSPEITLKYYAHLRSRNDEHLQKKMNGNIKLNFSKETYIDFSSLSIVEWE